MRPLHCIGVSARVQRPAGESRARGWRDGGPKRSSPDARPSSEPFALTANRWSRAFLTGFGDAPLAGSGTARVRYGLSLHVLGVTAVHWIAASQSRWKFTPAQV